MAAPSAAARASCIEAKQMRGPPDGAVVVGLLGLFLLAFPITFFNRPRFLVPPHQRDEPGAVEEWRRARGARPR